MLVEPSLMQLSEADLYELVGRDLMRPLKGSSPTTPTRLVETGKKWFADKEKAIQLAVCGSATIRTLAENADALALVEGIAALLASLFTQVTPAPVAVLLFKIGIHKYCEKQWN